MKPTLTILLLSASLTAFGQDAPRFCLHAYHPNIRCVNCDVPERPAPNPDTLRAICLVSLFHNGIAHARMGYVVIEQGKRPVYLDCRKRALKYPQVGWGWGIVNPNKEK